MADVVTPPAGLAAAATHANELKRLWSLFHSDDPEALNQILASPLTAALMQGVNKKASADEGVIFCKCPECGTSFETELS